MEQMTSFLSANSLQRDVHRKTAMMVNIAYGLLSALKVAVKETRSASGSLRGAAVEKVMQDLLHVSTYTRKVVPTYTYRSSSFCPIRPFVDWLVKHWVVFAAAQAMLSLETRSTIWSIRSWQIASPSLVLVMRGR